MKPPKRIELSPDQIKTLLERVSTRSLEDADYAIIEGMIETIIFLSQLLEEKNVSIKRLLKMVFGISTESSKNVLGKNKVPNKDNKGTDGQSPESSPPPDNNQKDEADQSPDDSRKDNSDQPPDDNHKEEPDQKSNKVKGHGRNGADTYTGAQRTFVPHSTLKSGDQCPACLKGRVYRIGTPKVVVRVVGKAPLEARVWELESLRCNLCGEVFTAEPPAEVGPEKYDETCGAMISLLKYGSGFPFYRLEGLQKSLGIPLPASTQWEIVEAAADKIYPVYEELIRQAAQGQILYNDDTMIKVLSLMKSQEDTDESSRKGMFTTGILSINDGHKIALYFSGQNHAGENINDLLEKRQSGLTPPIQMCDALSRNISKDFQTVLANCLAHARRKFTDIIFCFPDECRYVIETLAKVYYHDELAKEQGMSADERLKFHQEKSSPLMEELKLWFNEQIEGKKVEPNSSLGKAIFYMQNHWEALTLFLRVPSAPLDNNLCEQILKRAILHRKNSMFYKTEFGAYIGDLSMSLIYTCYLNTENPFDYLVALQKYSKHIFKNPHLWMPWNYKSTISSIESVISLAAQSVEETAKYCDKETVEDGHFTGASPSSPTVCQS